MRISITVKLCLGVFAILTGALTVLLWKTSGILKDDKIAYLKEQTAQISYGLALGASEKIKRLDRQMNLYMTNSPAVALSKTQSNSEFYSVGILNRELGKAWSVQWGFKSQSMDQSIDQLMSEFITNIQKSVRLDEVRSGEQMILRVLTPDRQPVFVLLSRQPKTEATQENISVALLKISTFFDLISAYKGGVQSAYLVDSNALVFAHPMIHLTGTQLADDPIASNISRGFATSTVEQYVRSDGTSLIGSYDHVPGTNLYAASSIPWNRASLALGQLRSSFFILGIGLITIALALTYWSAQMMRQPLIRIKRAVEDMAAGRAAVIELGNDDEIGDLAESLFVMDQKLQTKELESRANVADQIYKSKMGAFSQFSSGLVNELRNPLIGILGHVQLAKEKIRDPENLRRHLDFIEDDCRKTKEFIEDISQFTGTDKLDLNTINIYETTVAAIEQAERKLHPQNISVVRNLASSSSIIANPVLVRKALQNILSASGLFTSTEAPREIVFRLESLEQEVELTCLFNSQLIDSEHIPSIFDPFFKTSADLSVSPGLDLALAKGIIEAHDGHISFEKLATNQFQFRIRFPKALDQVKRDDRIRIGEMVTDPLQFSLPHFSIQDKGESEAPSKGLAVIPPIQIDAKVTDTSNFLTEKKIFGRIPLEKLKIKVKQPRLRS